MTLAQKSNGRDKSLPLNNQSQSFIGDITAPAVGSGFLQSTNSLFAGGKNSSTGNWILSNKSHGVSSLAPTHSFCGIQKSYDGISS